VFKEGISKFLKLDHLMENLTGYVETRIEILKYDLKEDLSKGAAKILVFLGLGMIATFFVFFTTFAVAFMLADYLGTFEGFAIVSGFYLLIGIALFWKRNDFIARIEKEIKQVIKHKKK
jgi:uncharacterized membrane protein YqjE